MDILNLIKDRRTIRKYQDKPIPKEIVDKIIEAGIWGPSLLAPGFQPWKFIVIEDKNLIKEIGNILLKESPKRGAGVNIILRWSAETILNAQLVIIVCDVAPLGKVVKKISESYLKFTKAAELSAISAAIQNMILTTHSLGVGSCWLDAPLFCKKEIDKLIGNKDKLVAALAFGYPAEEGKRSKRKSIAESVQYLK